MTHELPQKAPLAVLMPSEVSGRIGFFDRFAGRAALLASRAPFFAFCLLLVVAWTVEGLVRIAAGGGASAFLDDKFQLQINTTTTIITFLLVALLQNSQSRDDLATQHKLNAIADGLADFMERTSERYDDEELRSDIVELRLAVGLEVREGSKRGTDFTPSPSRRTDEPDTPAGEESPHG